MNNMDIFVEQLLQRKQGPKDYAITAAAILGAVIIFFLSLKVPAFTFFILVLVCFGAYWVIASRHLEFEYSITNGDITIDKIINRSRRKRVLSADAREIEEIGKFRPELVRQKSGFKPYFVSEYGDGRDAWYFCSHTAKNGNVLVVFSPEEKTLEAIKPFIPRQVAFVAFGRN